jgi:stage II sporulation SpoAA-like protein
MIKTLPQSSDSVLGFEVTSKVSLEEEKELIAKIEKHIEEHGNLKVLVVLDEGANWSIKAGIEDLKWVMTHLKKIDKIAIVSTSTIWKWLISIDGLFAPMVGVGEKHFETAKLDDAWKWVQE